MVYPLLVYDSLPSTALGADQIWPCLSLPRRFWLVNQLMCSIMATTNGTSLISTILWKVLSVLSIKSLSLTATGVAQRLTQAPARPLIAFTTLAATTLWSSLGS